MLTQQDLKRALAGHPVVTVDGSIPVTELHVFNGATREPDSRECEKRFEENMRAKSKNEIR